jgi:hypothetical protein
VEFQLIEVMKTEMPLIQFDSIVNLIQMKLMKVIDNMKNMMIQEFQHSVEFQSIEVVKTEMPLIRFDSIVNLIQMKLMKVIDNHKNMMIQEFQYHDKFQYLATMKSSESSGDQQNQQGNRLSSQIFHDLPQLTHECNWCHKMLNLR